MEGPDHHDVVMKGMIPRMFQRLFELIEEADEEIEFTVKVSFLEIYMEKIMDLLDPKKSNLRVMRDPNHGIYVKD
jgi:kinesin family protein 5